MPITIFDPVTSGPFGPGFSLHVESDFIGPVQQPHWEIQIEANNGEQLLYDQSLPNIGPGFRCLSPFLNAQTVPLPAHQFESTVPHNIRARLMGDSGQVEELRQPITLDMSTGLLASLNNVVIQSQGTTAGFQPADRNLLQGIYDAVWRAWRV